MNYRTIIEFIINNYLKILVILLSLLLTLFFVIFAIKLVNRKNLTKIAEKFITPKPFFGSFATKMLNKLVKHEVTNEIIKLKETIFEKFGSLTSVPIILELYDSELQHNILKLSDANSTFGGNDSIMWCITNKLVTLSIESINLPNVLPVFQELFENISFNVLVINFKKSLLNLSSDLNFIYANIQTILPVVLIYNPEAMFLQSFSDLFDNFISDIIFLNSLREMISNNIDQISNSNMITKSVNFVTKDKISIDSKVNFLENLYFQKIYSLANESKQINTQSFVKDYKILKILFYLFFISMALFTYFKINNINQRNQCIKSSINVSYKVINNQIIDEVKVLNSLVKINEKNFSYLTEFYSPKDIKNIIFVRNFLITNCSMIFDKINEIKTPTEFQFSPIETQAFQKLEYNIKNLTNALDGIFNFISTINKEDFSQNNTDFMNTKLIEYSETCREKILSNFVDFAEGFSNFRFLKDIEELTNSINQLIQNPSVDALDNIIKLSKNIKEQFGLGSHAWWIQGTLGNPIQKLLSVIKKIPKVGDII